ncbi:4Fe-4S dicluster domain-containing protein [Thermicanus aegyptius]|uniref:4Fe-4S dicluster domain-containing protein n=1 Tax=Thermicanus aegyptius TaxID=94009 RepID=UPI0003470C7F|nr:4Fe-4S dicluster domain-containing protein [Thermicanus aegyptius]
MGKRYAFVIHMDRCIGCSACTLACKSYYRLQPGMVRRRVKEMPETITGAPTRAYLSTACNHCDDPACKKACPVGAYSKREDGIVVHHQDRCIGCKMCIKACPYGVPQFDPVKKKADKCSLCFERLDKGELPICVLKCPMEAIEIVDMEKENRGDLVDRVPGYADPSITHPSTRFVLPKTGLQFLQSNFQGGLNHE